MCLYRWIVNRLTFIIDIRMSANADTLVENVFKYYYCFAFKSRAVKLEYEFNCSVCLFCRKGLFCCYSFAINKELFTCILIHELTLNSVLLTYKKILVLNCIDYSYFLGSLTNVIVSCLILGSCLNARMMLGLVFVRNIIMTGHLDSVVVKILEYDYCFTFKSR